ncbi:MAG: homoserine kinase [Marmoricola sp.]
MSDAGGSGFVVGPVTVAVPATSANLGPGFDCLGLALDLHDRLTAEVVVPAAGEDALQIEVVGEGTGTLPRSERHLVVRSMRAMFEILGVDPPGLRLHFANAIPQSRGLGSSSAAIVGGLALARALVVDGDRFDDHSLLFLANRIEGHPDNVAPALIGGFVVTGQAEDEVWAVSAPVDPAISAVAFVPPTGVSTEAARGLLPAEVPHPSAAANTGRAALLVTALAGAPDQLLRGTEDFLHQQYRSSAMPGSYGLVTALRADGFAAFISGAGPTVLVLGRTDDLAGLPDRCPDGWAVHPLAVDRAGVRVVPA